MTEQLNEQQKSKWIGLVVTTALGIAATVGVGWYQLAEAERQAVLAEQERARAVRSEMVSMVEEHALNNQSIDLPRLTRLADQRRREERVSIPITSSELLEKAEFNVLGSRYLPFARKQELKAVFDSAYAELTTREFAPFAPDAPNAETVNTLANQIQEGKATDALQTLRRLQESHSMDLQDARSERRAPSLVEALAEVFKDPIPAAAVLVTYLTILWWMVRRRPELVQLMRRLVAPGVTQTEARERIERYRAAGVPDDIIVERLRRKGVPRSWIFRVLGRTYPESPQDSAHETARETNGNP